jgi:alpha-tubulin suppressor-like RCC1 family protein
MQNAHFCDGRPSSTEPPLPSKYALLADGRVYAWGLGNHGQLGDGSTRNSFFRPVRVRFPAGVKIAFLPVNVMPFDTALAVDTTGHVWGWGVNGGGELCLGRQHERPARRRDDHEAVLAGIDHPAGRGHLPAAGQQRLHLLRCHPSRGRLFLGRRGAGQIGNGTTTGSLTPVKVAADATGISGTAFDVVISTRPQHRSQAAAG